MLEVMRQLEQQNAGDYAQAEQFLAAQERKTRAGAAAAAAAAAAMGVRVEGGDGLSPSQTPGDKALGAKHDDELRRASERT